MNVKNNIIYSAIVLSNTSRILSIIHPKFSKVYCYHITLKFGNQNIPDFIGKTINIQLLSYCYDNNIDAVKVKILDNEIDSYCNNNISHITISTNNNVKPVYSNQMLMNTHHEIELDNFIITGIVGCFTNNGWIYNRKDIKNG